MWNYEKALQRAMELKPGIDYCVEYENAYMFAAESERFNIGGDGPIFIMKNTGQALGSTAYYDTAASAIVREAFNI